MAVKHSTERILTTHVGSLPRPHDLLDQMQAQVNAQPVDAEAFAARVRRAVAESVQQQAEHGLDVVGDGEQSKLGFFSYISDRLTGFEARPRGPQFEAETQAFPEYYAQYFSQAMLGGAIAPPRQLVCTGPVTYRGQAALERDIDNLRAALQDTPAVEAFMPAVAPSGVGRNEFYPSQEAYLFAVGDALRAEYQAILDAGFVLQVDDPWLSEIFSAGRPASEVAAEAELYVAATNRALAGLPAERIRFHTCYGINHGPRVHDAALGDLVDVLLRVNAGAYSFEAANPRHEHEYHVWERVRLPEDRVLIPGVITHGHNFVEHPELIAERITNFARLVGRERVIAGADCGFSSQATYRPEVDVRVMWAKFDALAEGAHLASERLWAS